MMGRLLLSLLALTLCAPAHAQTPFNAYNNLGFSQGNEFLMDNGSALFNNVMGATGNRQLFFNSSGTFAGNSTLVFTSSGSLGVGDASPDTGEQPLILDVAGAIGGSYFCDASGNDCFTAASVGGVAGSNTQIIYNSSGSLAGDAGLTYNDVTNNLTATTFTGALTGNSSTATALATARAIYGNNFDGTAALAQVIASTYGGTGNGFTRFTGPTTSEKTFTLPNATATILTSNAAVTVAQGGTGLATLTANNVILGNGTSTPLFVAPGSSGNVLTSNGTTWASAAPPSGASVAGSDREIQFNSSSAFGASSTFVWSSAGNLGVGTALPTSKLHVSGTGNITGNTTIGGTLGVTGVATFTSAGSFGAPLTVPDDAYASGWNGSTAVPTKNALYDKIETLGSGKLLQVGYAEVTAGGSTTGTIALDNSIPQNSEGAEAVTLAFTPISASSSLYIDAVVVMASNATRSLTGALFVDSTADAFAATSTYVPGADFIATLNVGTKIASGSTSARTYKLRYGGTGGTTYLNSNSVSSPIVGVSRSYIRVMEVGP